MLHHCVLFALYLLCCSSSVDVYPSLSGCTSLLICCTMPMRFLDTSHLAPHLLHDAHALYCVCSVFVSFALQDGVLIVTLMLIEVGHEAPAVSGAPPH